MSAFIMSDTDFLILTHAARHYLKSERPMDLLCYEPNRHPLPVTEWQGILDILVAENYRSVNYRYREENPPPTLTYKPVPLPPAIAILKLTHCYDYQSCETEDYYTTPAAKIASEIRDNIIRALPGYEEAPWGSND